jgi:hypothetical protein
MTAAKTAGIRRPGRPMGRIHRRREGLGAVYASLFLPSGRSVPGSTALSPRAGGHNMIVEVEK